MDIENPDQDQEQVRAELEALEKELSGEAAKPIEPAPTEEPPKEEEPFDVKQAAKDVFARLSREEQIEWLKERGLDTVDPKQVAKDEQTVATGAAKMTAQTMLKSLDSVVTPEDLQAIEGYDELDEDDQFRIKSHIAIGKEAKRLVDEELMSYRQAQAQAQMNAELDHTATQWAQELETPDAAQVGREYLSQFSPEEIAFYKQQASQGGGAFVKLVQDGFKNTVEQFKAQKVAAVKEEEPPKAEPAGGKETYGAGSSDADGLAEYLAQKPEFANDKKLLDEVRGITV